MNTPKEMADYLRRGSYANRAPITEIVQFLDNLPTVPEGHTWNGEIHSVEPGEWFLNRVGTVEKWVGLCGSSYDCFPILRKIEPEFKPGEIVVNKHGYCCPVDSEGRVCEWDGEVLPLKEQPWKVATPVEFDKFLGRRNRYGVAGFVIRAARKLYGGGGEGEGNDDG